jgi:hypothetical protein
MLASGDVLLATGDVFNALEKRERGRNRAASVRRCISSAAASEHAMSGWASECDVPRWRCTRG